MNTKLNPSKKRLGLVHGNVYGAGGKCIGKRWMTEREAQQKYAMNQTYLNYLKYRDEMVIVPVLPRWKRLLNGLKTKMKKILSR